MERDPLEPCDPVPEDLPAPILGAPTPLDRATGTHTFAGTSGEPFIVPLATHPDRAPGWLVRVPLPDQLHRPSRAAVITRTFRGGSMAESLERARRWRDEWHLKLWGRPVPTRFFHRQQANGRTGVPGVRRQVKRFRSSGRDYAVEVFVAEVWLQPGRHGERPRQSRSRLFSIAKWGEQAAFEMACTWRREAEDRLARGEPWQDGQRSGRRRAAPPGPEEAHPKSQR